MHRSLLLAVLSLSVLLLGVLLGVAPAWAQTPIETEVAKLLASDGATGAEFGRSVAVAGDTAVIGAPGPAFGRGAAYVFTRDGAGVWTQQAKLTAGAGFGSAVAVTGDTALIGAPWGDNHAGAAYVFTRSGTAWTLQATLVASDRAGDDFFGSAVALAGDTALIGSPFDDDKGDSSGAVYVFARSGTTWTQQAKLLASDRVLGDGFGGAVAVAVDGDTALIGAIGADDHDGAAYVFTRSGTTWTEQAKLVASDRVLGDGFGQSVAMAGDTALIGAFAPGRDGSGEAYVFTRSGTTWTLQATLLSSNTPTTFDAFGFAVAVDGDTAVIGAPSKDGSGAVYVFVATPIVDTTPPVVTVAASPETLSPPNGKLVTVTVSGMITDTEPDDSGVQASMYQVIDEYGQVQPTGSVIPAVDGSYAFTVKLQASRNAKDKDGRRYTIEVSATDTAGNEGDATATVTVPR